MQILHGDCLAVLPTLDANSIDAVLTDPPAGISFMGKHWDHDKGGRDHWIAWMQQVAAECLRIIKPGGHALVWALPRTSHWTATAWENAGWEVRDVIHHIFGTGFPKSAAIDKAIDRHLGADRKMVAERRFGGRSGETPTAGASNGGVQGGYNYRDERSITAPSTPEAAQWSGFGSALKPAVENWLLLRRPLIGTLATNVLQHGTGGLNIDATRVVGDMASAHYGGKQGDGSKTFGQIAGNGYQTEAPVAGRWPSNLIHDGSDEVVSLFPQRTSPKPRSTKRSPDNGNRTGYGTFGGQPEVVIGYGDEGSAARFFYCAKASKRDRCGSKHPTVKPIALLKYLLTLITPPGGTVLDPFAGSGTTGMAAAELGFDCILIEREAEYIADCERRVSHYIPTSGCPDR